MKKITLFFVAMFIALTTFAADIAGGTKFFLDLRTASNSIGKQANAPYSVVFTNGETTSEAIAIAYNGAKLYRFEAPAGTWTGITVTATKNYAMNLTYDGVNNSFAAAKNPSDVLTLVDGKMVYSTTDGTWSKVPVEKIPAGIKFYIDLSLNSTAKRSTYFPATFTFTNFDGSVASDAITVEYNGETNVYEATEPSKLVNVNVAGK